MVRLFRMLLFLFSSPIARWHAFKHHVHHHQAACWPGHWMLCLWFLLMLDALGRILLGVMSESNYSQLSSIQLNCGSSPHRGPMFTGPYLVQTASLLNHPSPGSFLNSNALVVQMFLQGCWTFTRVLTMMFRFISSARSFTELTRAFLRRAGLPSNHRPPGPMAVNWHDPTLAV